ncbi:hypothetical protein GOODEAATRI_027281 [Goodea atripinnis]|uniref:Uncharacterized protein n=1 Tax=Goodea atripinnis TaxID=208336 RepID=A0ABV0NE11_9TELE
MQLLRPAILVFKALCSYARPHEHLMKWITLFVELLIIHFMVNGLDLYSALSSPQRPRSALHYNQSSSHSYTPTVVSYIVATAALGQTDRRKAAIQSAPPSSLTTISNQGE